MKVLFYGTPAVAVPFLELLASRETVVAAVSQPDKPAGRSLRVEPTPVKKRALELGIPVLQPASSAKIASELKGLEPDLAVAVAYGKILKADALAVPRLGTLNVHFSLLPKFRGAAPVQWTLVRGEARAGVSVFWLDEGMDTGPLQLQKETEVGPDEDSPRLLERLKDLGLSALEEALGDIAAGRIRREPQSGQASLAPLIRKEDARLVLSKGARELHDLVRGMRLWPRAFLDLELPGGRQRLLVLKTRLADAASPAAAAGRPGRIERIERGGGILIQCGDGNPLWLLSVQPEGKNPVAAADFLNGLRMGAGDFLPVIGT